MSCKYNLSVILVMIMWLCPLFAKAEMEKEKKVSGSLSAGGSLSSGNINKADVKATGGLAVKDTTFEFVMGGRYNFSKTDDKIKNNGIELNSKVDFMPYRKWSPLIAFEYIHNTYKGYNYRLDVVAGAKYNIYLKPKVSDYSISLAGLYDVVDYTDDKKTLDDNAFRLSLRPKIKQQIGPSVYLVEKFFYQPQIDDFSDFLFKNETEIECKVTKIFYLSVIYEYDYRSVLPPIKENTTYMHNDHSLEVALKIKL
ncbi:MAG: DUF481 domain-containing protein [Paludibacteraceae bacterium]|nr:DUF481 domain-containing protein [Paludibacteraceae bacterium]